MSSGKYPISTTSPHTMEQIAKNLRNLEKDDVVATVGDVTILDITQDSNGVIFEDSDWKESLSRYDSFLYFIFITYIIG